MKMESGSVSRRLLQSLTLTLVVASFGCGGGGGNSPTAPPVALYSIAGQLVLQNLGFTNSPYTILEAEIQFDGRTIASCEEMIGLPGVGGALLACGNIYRAAAVSPGSHTLSCHLIRQTNTPSHLYYCFGAFGVFDASGVEVSRRQLGTVSGQLQAGDSIEIQVSVP